MLDDTVLLTLGARHQNMKTENFAYDTGVAADPYDESRVSPVVGAVFRVSPRVSLYGNYVEGLTQGETAPGTAINNGEMLEPYVSKQKEIGVKVDSGSFGAGLAAFSTTRPRAFINAAGLFVPEGEDLHQGLEFTVFGEAAGGLRVLGGATWLDTEQRSTGSTATDGKRVIGVPEFQANLGLDWDVPGAPGVALDGRVVHTGSSYADAGNTLEVPGWTRLDVGARYLAEVAGRALTLRARIDNVTNRDYWASVGGYPGQGYLVVGAPRTYTLSASVDF